MLICKSLAPAFLFRIKPVSQTFQLFLNRIGFSADNRCNTVPFIRAVTTDGFKHLLFVEWIKIEMKFAYKR